MRSLVSQRPKAKPNEYIGIRDKASASKSELPEFAQSRGLDRTLLFETGEE